VDRLLLLSSAPFVIALALHLLAARIIGAVRPSVGVPLLTVASVVVALGCGFVLALAAFTLLAPLPALVAIGHWSPHALTAQDRLPVAAGLLPAAVLLASLSAGARSAVRHLRAIVHAQQACRELGPGAAGLVVVETEDPHAFAVCGLASRIVVSTGLLRALPADERRALIAHERSHVRHRHDLYIHLGQVAAATNPLLRGCEQAIRLGSERWADHDAATVTCAHTVLRAIAHTLDRGGSHRHSDAIRHHPASGNASRVGSLAGPRADPGRAILALATVAFVLATGSAAISSARLVETRFEHAQAAYRIAALSQLHGA
jgi:hypothetical protein